ncbi:hypothetical protein ABIB25_005477 [Nakamurella sp. UYEF19]|uniref:DnaJ family domain-containing protein n=1 Tax=Nakamurella sp. UYEF19 TaxID=1756392 RepID=UPI003390A3A9
MSQPGQGAGGRIERIVERQIREAEERGVFDDLPGAGKPLGDIGGPRDENWWLRQYMLREGISGVPFLPPALALRKEAQDLPATVAKLRTEAQVREVVAKLNQRIVDVLRKPAEGPSMTLMPVDADDVVIAWRRARAATATPVANVPEPPVGRRRWFGRR